MAGNLRSSYLEIQSSFEPLFKGFSLEELWSHPELRPFFKNKETRELLLLELDNKTFIVKRYYGPGAGLFRYVIRGFRDRYGPENEWQKAKFLKVLGIKASEPVAFCLNPSSTKVSSEVAERLPTNSSGRSSKISVMNWA